MRSMAGPESTPWVAQAYSSFKIVDAVIGLKANEHEERVGLDLTQHREAGYTMLD